jgi:hypothetical protein
MELPCALCMASCTTQGCDSSCAIASTKPRSSIFTCIDVGEQSHVSAAILQRCLFDSAHIYFLLYRTREVYLSVREASTANTSILTAFPSQTSRMKKKIYISSVYLCQVSFGNIRLLQDTRNNFRVRIIWTVHAKAHGRNEKY